MERWQEADQGLIRSRGEEAEVLARQLSWLTVAREEKAHRQLGFGSFVEYVMNRLGVGRRTAFDRMRLAAELPKLPRLREELGSGRLMPCAIRALLTGGDLPVPPRSAKPREPPPTARYPREP